MLKIENLSFSYNKVQVLNDISFNLEEGKILGLIGPNGSGKSTLLKNILHLVKPDLGRITLDNENIAKMSLTERATKISYVPQFTTPNFSHNVFYTVLMGRKPYIGWNYSKEDEEKTREILTQMKLEELSERLFSHLSGGEKQKTILARAIAQNCNVMLLDEPTSNLDLKHKQEFMLILREKVDTRRVSILIAIHDLNLAAAFCDKIILLNRGQKFMEGRPEEVMTKENIEKIYEVSVDVLHHENVPYIILNQSISFG